MMVICYSLVKMYHHKGLHPCLHVEWEEEEEGLVLLSLVAEVKEVEVEGEAVTQCNFMQMHRNLFDVFGFLFL